MKLLENLNGIINDNPDFDYLVNPIKEILNEVNKSISLTNYLITDKTILELKKRRKEIKLELPLFNNIINESYVRNGHREDIQNFSPQKFCQKLIKIHHNKILMLFYTTRLQFN